MQGEELDITERLTNKISRHKQVRLANAPHSTAMGSEEKMLSEALSEIVNLRAAVPGRGVDAAGLNASRSESVSPDSIIEKCAELCERQARASASLDGQTYYIATGQCAAAIRKLKGAT